METLIADVFELLAPVIHLPLFANRCWALAVNAALTTEPQPQAYFGPAVIIRPDTGIAYVFKAFIRVIILLLFTTFIS